MERKQLSVLFIISRTRVLKNGEVAIRVRITYDGYSKESQISRTVPLKQWSQARGCSLGKTRDANELNAYLDTVRSKILEIHHDLERNGELISAEQIRDIYAGKTSDTKTLFSVFAEHNERYRKQIGTVYSAKTVGRYDTCLRYLREFVKGKYKKSDISFNELNHEFIRNFEFFVKTEKKCAPNAATRYMKRLKKIATLARAYGLMIGDPFIEIKFRDIPVNKEVLTQTEVDKIENKMFTIERLDHVRDVFLFCCYTGLAFVDVLNLRKEHLLTDPKGNMVIHKAREKTKQMCSIPLLAIPAQIIEKYKDHYICQDKGLLLPVMSNQKMNSYLREIADMCGITKKVTTHTARHTFASVITLANNIPLTTVSKMMGHSNVIMTQRYAKVMDSSIMKEMQRLDAVLARNTNS